MATPQEQYVNEELPKRIGFAAVPAGGNATAGKFPRFTGVGLTIEQVDGGSGTGNKITVSSSAPAAPAEGDLWIII